MLSLILKYIDWWADRNGIARCEMSRFQTREKDQITWREAWTNDRDILRPFCLRLTWKSRMKRQWTPNTAERLKSEREVNNGIKLRVTLIKIKEHGNVRLQYSLFSLIDWKLLKLHVRKVFVYNSLWSKKSGFFSNLKIRSQNKHKLMFVWCLRFSKTIVRSDEF